MIKQSFYPTPETIFVGNGTDQTAAVQALFANSGHYVFKGTVITGAITVTDKNITIDFEEGAILKPNAELDKLWTFVSCNVIYKRFNVDGLGLCQIASNHTTSGTLKFDIITMTNIGWPVHLSTGLIVGVSCDSLTDISGNYFRATGFNGVGNGDYSGVTGGVRGMAFQSCGPYDIKHFEYDATGTTAQQMDMFHAVIGNTGGTIHNFVARYNHKTRRCIKWQSGYNSVLRVDIQKSSDFTAVSGSTNVGEQNLNCIDWAAGLPGRGSVGVGFIDASGFQTGICNSASQGIINAGPGLQVNGGTLQVIRNFPDTGAPQTTECIGFSTTTGSGTGCGMVGVKMVNFTYPIYMIGSYGHIRDCLFINPVTKFAIGDLGNSVQNKGIVFENNAIVTSTSGYLNSTNIFEVGNVLNCSFKNNQFIEDGNVTHAATLFKFNAAAATGNAFNNAIPSSMGEVNLGSSTVNAPSGITAARGFQGQQYFAEQPLTDASPIAWNLSSQQAAYVLLTSGIGATRTLQNPTNVKDGATYTLMVQQSSTGSNALLYGTSYKFPGGSAPVLSTANNAIDILTFIAHGGLLYGVGQLSFS